MSLIIEKLIQILRLYMPVQFRGRAGRPAGQYNAPGGVISRGAPLNLFAHDDTLSCDIGIGRNNWIRWPNNNCLASELLTLFSCVYAIV
jgi:hypothetical protein